MIDPACDAPDVPDAVAASYDLLADPTAYGDVYNVGVPDPTSINDLARRVIELTNSDSDVAYVPLEEVYSEAFEEPDRCEPDVSKLRETLRWAPRATSTTAS